MGHFPSWPVVQKCHLEKPVASDISLNLIVEISMERNHPLSPSHIFGNGIRMCLGIKMAPLRSFQASNSVSVKCTIFSTISPTSLPASVLAPDPPTMKMVKTCTAVRNQSGSNTTFQHFTKTSLSSKKHTRNTNRSMRPAYLDLMSVGLGIVVYMSLQALFSLTSSLCTLPLLMSVERRLHILMPISAL